MKITMYELLGLIKNGKAPNHIKYNNEDWYWGYDTYIPEGFLNDTPDVQIYTSLFNRYRLDYCLNEKVEIIEKPKKIEKWGKGALEEMENYTDYKIKDLQKYIKILAETQNELIDEIDKLKKQLIGDDK